MFEHVNEIDDQRYAKKKKVYPITSRDKARRFAR